MAKKQTKSRTKPPTSKKDAHSYWLNIAETATSLEQLEEAERHLSGLSPDPPPRSKPAPRQSRDELQYQKKKRREAARQREKSRAGRDIAASCPDCVSPETRDQLLAELKLFLEVVFFELFYLEPGEDQLELIRDLQRAIEEGDQLAIAMPRASGKTTILLAAIIWAILKGKHQFAVLVAATGPAAKELLEKLTAIFETNDVLYDYFPELIHPIRKLEGIRQRRLLWKGQLIQQQWKKDRIILPNVPGAPGGNAMICCVGIRGRMRGLSHMTNGKAIRPSLVLVDDPQTDESAASAKQNATREKVLCQTIPGLAGPGKKISVLVACTVIQRDDLADRILDRQRHPEFHGKRKKLLRKEPTAKDLWSEYAEILRECLRCDEGIEKATRFYVKNRDAMDAGADPSWPARFNEDEASAIQYAMNIKILKPEAFASEYQNEPIVIELTIKQTIPEEVLKRLSGHKRGAVPLGVEHICAGIDVQKNYLVWVIIGFEPNARGYVINYGTWPDQQLHYFDRRTSTRTIEAEFPKLDEAAQIWNAFEALTKFLFEMKFTREDDHEMKLHRACVDVRYQGDAIKRFIKAKASTLGDSLLAAQGVYIPAGAPGLTEREAKPGEISKHDFRLPPIKNGQITRVCSFDSAEYITKVHDALQAHPSSTGALTLFDADSHIHRCYVDQLCSEYSEWVERRNRKKRMWEPKPNGGDNDYLDATKLAFLAGFTRGMEPSYMPPKKPKSSTGKKREPKCSVF